MQAHEKRRMGEGGGGGEWCAGALPPLRSVFSGGFFGTLNAEKAVRSGGAGLGSAGVHKAREGNTGQIRDEEKTRENEV